MKVTSEKPKIKIFDKSRNICLLVRTSRSILREPAHDIDDSKKRLDKQFLLGMNAAITVLNADFGRITRGRIGSSSPLKLTHVPLHITPTHTHASFLQFPPRRSKALPGSNLLVSYLIENKNMFLLCQAQVHRNTIAWHIHALSG